MSDESSCLLERVRLLRHEPCMRGTARATTPTSATVTVPQSAARQGPPSNRSSPDAPARPRSRAAAYLDRGDSGDEASGNPRDLPSVEEQLRIELLEKDALIRQLREQLGGRVTLTTTPSAQESISEHGRDAGTGGAGGWRRSRHANSPSMAGGAYNVEAQCPAEGPTATSNLRAVYPCAIQPVVEVCGSAMQDHDSYDSGLQGHVLCAQERGAELEQSLSEVEACGAQLQAELNERQDREAQLQAQLQTMRMKADLLERQTDEIRTGMDGLLSLVERKDRELASVEGTIRTLRAEMAESAGDPEGIPEALRRRVLVPVASYKTRHSGSLTGPAARKQDDSMRRSFGSSASTTTRSTMPPNSAASGGRIRAQAAPSPATQQQSWISDESDLRSAGSSSRAVSPNTRILWKAPAVQEAGLGLAAVAAEHVLESCRRRSLQPQLLQGYVPATPRTTRTVRSSSRSCSASPESEQTASPWEPSAPPVPVDQPKWILQRPSVQEAQPQELSRGRSPSQPRSLCEWMRGDLPEAGRAQMTPRTPSVALSASQRSRGASLTVPLQPVIAPGAVAVPVLHVTGATVLTGDGPATPPAPTPDCSATHRPGMSIRPPSASSADGRRAARGERAAWRPAVVPSGQGVSERGGYAAGPGSAVAPGVAVLQVAPGTPRSTTSPTAGTPPAPALLQPPCLPVPASRPLTPPPLLGGHHGVGAVPPGGLRPVAGLLPGQGIVPGAQPLMPF